MSQLHFSMAATSIFNHYRITPQQRKALYYVMEGCTNKQISEYIGIAERGVENLLIRAYKKLGQKKRESVIIFLARNNYYGKGYVRPNLEPKNENLPIGGYNETLQPI